MSNFNDDENLHPEMDENLEINPNTPNSYKEILERKKQFKNKKSKRKKNNKNQHSIKFTKLNFGSAEINNMEEFGRMLDEIDNPDPNFKVFAALVFLSNLEMTPVADKKIILSLLEKLELFSRKVLEDLEYKLQEYDINIGEESELEEIKKNLLRIRNNYPKLQEAFMLIKQTNFID